MTENSDSPRDKFPTTQLNLVLTAGKGDGDQSGALATVCRIYWYPLYAFVRRQGYGPDDAQDLTQGFFARLLEKKYLHDYRHDRGRFRSFLLVSLKHFLANDRDWCRAQKRGGGISIVSLETSSQDSENRYSLEPQYDITPEQIFERHWALALLDHVLSRLEAEFTESGKTEQFARLKNFLTGSDQDIRYKQIAAQLGTTEGAAKVTVHRLRRRFRELLREEISQTVAQPEDVRDEIRYLMTVIGRVDT